jgi:hypothetical protein
MSNMPVNTERSKRKNIIPRQTLIIASQRGIDNSSPLINIFRRDSIEKYIAKIVRYNDSMIARLSEDFSAHVISSEAAAGMKAIRVLENTSNIKPKQTSRRRIKIIFVTMLLDFPSCISASIRLL